MDRYTLIKLQEKDIPWLMEMELIEGPKLKGGTGIFLSSLSEEEWLDRINTYEYAFGMWDSVEECWFGYSINCRIENNIWIRQMLVIPEYRKTSKDNWGGEHKRPVPLFLQWAKEMGGYCLIGAKLNNAIVRGAAEGKNNFEEVCVLNDKNADGTDNIILKGAL